MKDEGCSTKYESLLPIAYLPFWLDTLRGKVGRIEDASLQDSSCCSSSCLLPSLRPLSRDYVVALGTAAPCPTRQLLADDLIRLTLTSFYGRTCLPLFVVTSPRDECCPDRLSPRRISGDLGGPPGSMPPSPQ